MDASQTPLVIAFGTFREDERARLTAIGEAARVEVRHGGTHDELVGLLSRGPKAIVAEAASPQLSQLCQAVRARDALAAAPIIAVAPELEDALFAKVLNAGGDDLVDLSGAGLLGRLRLARDTLRPPDPEPRGVAVVAAKSDERRLCRALEQAGFAAERVDSVADALRRIAATPPAVVVLEAELEGARDALKRGVQSGTVHVLLSPKESAPSDAEELEEHANAGVIDEDAPAESVVFLVNELQKPGAANRRRTRRVPYGTLVAFCGEEHGRVEYGFSHNLSAGGVYVRTLAQLEEDTVFVRLRPPRAKRWVHLEGRVVWRRPYGPLRTATVPPGFGVQLTDATARSMEGWLDGYIAVVDALHSPVRSGRREKDDSLSAPS